MREDGVPVSERDDMIALVSRHLALWSVKDDDLRLGEINDVYGEEIEVTEPPVLPLGPGRLGLHKHIGLLQKLLGDFTFELDGDIDTHHGWAITDGLSLAAKSSTSLMGGSVFFSW